MKPLPFPVRIAAGLAVAAVEQARKLPQALSGLPVTVASQALQLSMRAQQRLTELAIKGDEVLAVLRPGEDEPEWATFDEDLESDTDEPAKSPTSNSDNDRALAGYDELSLPQLRARLRWLSEEQLLDMLDYEQQHANRPEFTRMLGNRLEHVRES